MAERPEDMVKTHRYNITFCTIHCVFHHHVCHGPFFHVLCLGVVYESCTILAIFHYVLLTLFGLDPTKVILYEKYLIIKI